MSYNIEGTVKLINDTMTFDSGFQKREIVITTQDDKFPQDVKLEFIKDSVTKLDEFKEGDFVKIAFSIRGNEYNGKYYVNLSAFAIAHTKPEAPAAPTPVAAEFPEADGEDDLPFADSAQILKNGIAKSELVAVKGVGHSPQEESPDSFNDKLLEFLNGIKW